MVRQSRAAPARIPKRGLGFCGAVRRFRELHGIGQDGLAQKAGMSQGYLSLIESGAFTGVTEDTVARIARVFGVEPWMLLAQAAGLKLEEVERFTEDERIWLDTYRALNAEQREVLLQLATVMRRPPPRKRLG